MDINFLQDFNQVLMKQVLSTIECWAEQKGQTGLNEEVNNLQFRKVFCRLICDSLNSPSLDVLRWPPFKEIEFGIPLA
ncbi:hypothetical protein CEXT_185571 [Caerostris extrusa]|uniref:Uncharacterized protein n=1 Tax=Caerostris extrusa TaxID=172846 RepID=A0AAV4SAH3_CAEEX|nr:hypothetical protein CEXT_185571 [Caerostris extrusa]